MPYITPLSIPLDTICRTLLIPNDLHLIAAINGALHELTKEKNWEKNSGVSASVAAQAMHDLFQVYMDGCSVMIEEIQVNPETGTLEYRNVGTTTFIPVQDTSGFMDYCCNPSSEFTLPPDVKNDELCFAAWTLARGFSDKFQDVLEGIDAALTVTVGTLQLVGLFPIVGQVVETLIEYLHDDLTQAVVDWGRTNIKDSQAIKLMAEQIYCALIQAKASGDFETFWSFIDYPQFMPSVSILYDPVGSVTRWLNMDDIVNWAFGLVDGTLMGWVTLSYMQMIYFVGLDELNLVSPLESIVAQSASKAQFLAPEDCFGFNCLGATCETQDFSGAVPFLVLEGSIVQDGSSVLEDVVDQITSLANARCEWDVPSGCVPLSIQLDVKSQSSQVGGRDIWMVVESRDILTQLWSGHLPPTIISSAQADNTWFTRQVSIDQRNIDRVRIDVFIGTIPSQTGFIRVDNIVLS